MPPLVSIILPSYNYGHYLDERIASILNQTFSDFELIIVDDASTDNSRDVIHRYLSDKRVKAHFFDLNSGNPFCRWNDGAQLAKGKYLWIAEADDRCHPRLLERLVTMLDMHPSAGIAYCQSQVIDSDGTLLHSCKEYTDTLDENRWSGDCMYSGQEQLRYLFYFNVVPNASAVLIRRVLYEQVGRADVRYPLVGDWHLWAKLMSVSDVAFVAEALNEFRSHPGTVRNTISRRPEHLIDIYEVHCYILSHCRLAIPPNHVDRIMSDLEDRWFKSILHKKRLGNFDQDLRLLNATYKIRPKILVRWVMEMGATIGERTFRRLIRT